MPRGVAIIGILGGVAAVFFYAVARQASDESAFDRERQFVRSQEQHATYAVTYTIDHSYGTKREHSRETAVRLDADRYRSETVDDTGYSVIVIERDGASFRCELSMTISPQCYRTDLPWTPLLDDVPDPLPFDAGQRERAVETLLDSPAPRPRVEQLIVDREVLGEPVRCFIEQVDDFRHEACYTTDGVELFARTEFVLAGRESLTVKEAVSIDRNPDSVDLEPPYPLVERPR